MASGLSQRPSSPPFDPEATPSVATLTRDRQWLRLAWPDGSQATLSASTLRLRCRCAWCTRDRLQDRFPAAFDDVGIARMDLIGGYAVHIAFTDEHARGIFPWVYLRELAQDGADAPAQAA